MDIMIVGGTFDEDGGRPSKLAGSAAAAIKGASIDLYNGGHYKFLEDLLNQSDQYDVVFWWANVPNHLPKVRDVKAVAPKVMLVNSKRNDNGRYKFGELVGRTLVAKANLTFEFSKQEDGKFYIHVFDPLGSSWYEGMDMGEAMKAAMNRLSFLVSITRNATIQSETSKQLAMAWYFDRFKEEMHQSGKNIAVPEADAFVGLVRQYAEVFQSLMPDAQTTRMLGNASMKPPQVGRCGKGMPSFRKDGYVFVSERNVDKQFLDISHFVPAYLEDGKVFYCGDKKPSVDTPIQLRLYERLKNINYMIHSHCYVEGAPFTKTCVPCGAVEEVDEVVDAIITNYGTLGSRCYRLNLIGHGSLVMGGCIDDLKDVEYVARPMPERMF